jgi:hypothetical protein
LSVSKSATKKFSDEWRPVKLDIRVIGYPDAKNAYLFDRNLNFRLFEIISQYSDGRPSLVFCSSRKGTSVAATTLGKDLSVRGNPFIKDREHSRRLLDASRRTSDKTLAGTLISFRRKSCNALQIVLRKASRTTTQAWTLPTESSLRNSSSKKMCKCCSLPHLCKSTSTAGRKYY